MILASAESRRAVRLFVRSHGSQPSQRRLDCVSFHCPHYYLLSVDAGRRPRTPRGYNSVITVEAGAHHVVALHSNGQVYTWGTGTFGRLGLSMGDGKKIRESADRPTLVETLSGRRVVSVSAGYTHTCAVLAGGSVVTWGSAVSGKLGLGEYTDEHECFCPTPTPVTIPAGRRVRFDGEQLGACSCSCLLRPLLLLVHCVCFSCDRSSGCALGVCGNSFARARMSPRVCPR